LHRKGLVYRGYKVMPYSTACTTPLSNFESGLNYKDVQDPAVHVSFPCIDRPGVSFVAWTTTPWTLPSNLALCVNPKFTYVQIKDKKSGVQYIILKQRVAELYPAPKKAAAPGSEEYEVVAELTGASLIGLKYEPVFPYFAHVQTAFRIISGEYVTDDSGTGIVHW
jgi:isoleucyl-tRNA synthetase